MPDNTIVAVAGLGLALWFMTSGSGQVSSMDTLLAELNKVAEPFLTVNAEKRLIADSWIYKNMKEVTVGWAKAREWRRDFNKMELDDIQRHVEGGLPEMVKDIKRMEKMYAVAVADALKDVHIDGPFKFETASELDPVKRFIEINYSVFAKWGQFIREVLAQLPGADTPAIDEVMKPFYDALNK